MKCYGVWCTEVLTWPRGGRKVSRRIRPLSRLKVRRILLDRQKRYQRQMACAETELRRVTGMLESSLLLDIKMEEEG